MDQFVKDWLQALAWFATAIGVLVTALKALSELEATRLQREQDLRWRQAEVGKALNDEMQVDKLAWPALQMLDSDSRTYKTRAGSEVEVAQRDISPALDPAGGRDDEKSEFVRDAFDTLFYFMAMFEHYTASGLVRAEDVAYPMEYYVPLLANHYDAVSRYLTRYNLWRTTKFLDRYQAWRSASEAVRVTRVDVSSPATGGGSGIPATAAGATSASGPGA